MVIYILTKFSDDWFIFVDARVLTRKLWTDGRTSDGPTPTDHNSSLSTPCSGELKTDTWNIILIHNHFHSQHFFRYIQATRTFIHVFLIGIAFTMTSHNVLLKPMRPLFLQVCSTSLSKMLWEMEKLLKTSIISDQRTMIGEKGTRHGHKCFML